MPRRVVPGLLSVLLLAGCYGSGESRPDADLGNVHQSVAPVCVAPVPEQAVVAPNRGEDYQPLLREAHAALQRGDYESAMLAYERVLGRADDPRDQVRALINLAMIRLLPSSRMQDDEAAAMTMDELRRRIDANSLQYEFFGEIELLQLIQGHARQLRGHADKEAGLRKEIAAKEELIRQLRALSVDAD